VASGRDAPEFGPRGYLPERAGRRARKIVLREQMGLGWPIASLLAGLVLLATGVVYVLTRVGAPDPPYADVGALEDLDARGAATVALPGADVDALAVRAGGGLRVFAAPGDDVVYCAESRRLESAAGAVWSVTGRLHGGPGRSLQPLPVEVHDGRVYVDATAELPRPAEDDRGEQPACW
jgi:hypothetical protein